MCLIISRKICETSKEKNKQNKKCCKSTDEGQEEQSRADDPNVDMANGLVASLSPIILDENFVILTYTENAPY